MMHCVLQVGGVLTGKAVEQGSKTRLHGGRQRVEPSDVSVQRGVPRGNQWVVVWFDPSGGVHDVGRCLGDRSMERCCIANPGSFEHRRGLLYLLWDRCWCWCMRLDAILVECDGSIRGVLCSGVAIVVIIGRIDFVPLAVVARSSFPLRSVWCTVFPGLCQKGETAPPGIVISRQWSPGEVTIWCT